MGVIFHDGEPPVKKRRARVIPARPYVDAAPANGADRVVDGAWLRETRHKRGLSVQGLSSHSGLAKSTISKIENNKMVPTVDLYTRLLAALDVDPPGWFRDTRTEAANDARFVEVRTAAEQVAVEHPAVSHKVLLSDDHHELTVLRQFFPAAVPEELIELKGHRGTELVVVIRGRLEVMMEGRDSAILNPGDTIHFSSPIPHFYKALDNEPCEVVLVWKK